MKCVHLKQEYKNKFKQKFRGQLITTEFYFEVKNYIAEILSCSIHEFNIFLPVNFDSFIVQGTSAEMNRKIFETFYEEEVF